MKFKTREKTSDLIARSTNLDAVKHCNNEIFQNVLAQSEDDQTRDARAGCRAILLFSIFMSDVEIN